MVILFFKILKNPFIGLASPFFGHQVAKIRHQKKTPSL